jgi:hypothetical protein
MTERKALTKGQRFDVFNRDGFTCQYCGSTPPSVVLHVDHVVSVANGGTNDDENLITACEDCNLGKGTKPVERSPQSLQQRTERIREKEEQVAAYHRLLQEIEARKERDIDYVEDVFSDHFPGYGFKPKFRRSVSRFLDKLTIREIVDAMDIAGNRKHDPEACLKYFCGICWRIIRGEDSNA